MKKGEYLTIIFVSLIFLSYFAQAATYYYRVKAINSYGNSSYSNTASVEVIPSCKLTNAYWNPASSATEGDSVELVAEGTNCDNEQINFEIWEDDGILGRNPPAIQPTGNFAFVNGKATVRWVAEWQSDMLTDPEYYFIATVAGKQISIDTKANMLNVIKAECGSGCAPQINIPISIGSISLVPGKSKDIVLEFNVRGDVININNNGASVKFVKGTNKRINSSCLMTNSGLNLKVFQCTIGMLYYDEAGEWGIDINVNDSAGNVIINNSMKFMVEELRDISLSEKRVSFPSMKVGAINIVAPPLNVSNNGNYNGSLKITPYNLHGTERSSEFIGASLFKISLSANVCSSGMPAINGTEMTLVSNILTGPSSKQEINYCLTSITGVSSQEYSTLPGYGWKIRLA